MLEAPDLMPIVREVELRRLDVDGHIYLDYTGAPPFPDSIVKQHATLLRRRTLGNPHSTNPAATAATEDITAAKAHVLQFFDADPQLYDVAFTANASAACKLVGESFPWDEDSVLALTADNHNSINGIREFARRAGARIEYLPLDDELRLPRPLGLASGRGLFAFPAQSNFSGVRHPLAWVTRAQHLGYHVLLDAAAYAPTARLSLRDVPADFVAISFYKMFGYPTGIGALIMRRDGMALLQRPAFMGGTVEFVSVARDDFQFRDGAAAFEDGTTNFLAASAIPLGLAFLQRVGYARIAEHITRLTQRLIAQLQMLPIDIYGPLTTERRGGTVPFNVRGLDCEIVVAAAAQAGISLRAGCFCNPGCAERLFGATRRGAVRASVGYGTTDDDVDSLITFLKANFT